MMYTLYPHIECLHCKLHHGGGDLAHDHPAWLLHAQGHGVEASCPIALSYAKQAARLLAAEVDREQRYAPALAPVLLRDRHMDGG